MDRKEYYRNWVQKNLESVREYKRNYNQRPETKEKNRNYYLSKQEIIKEKHRVYSKEYYKKNETLLKLKAKIYRQENKEKDYIRNRKYYLNNREKCNKKVQDWRNKNVLKVKLIRKRGRKKDKMFFIRKRIADRLRRIVKDYIKTGKIPSKNFLGIDYKAIIEGLKPFPEDISKYHIDHFLPLSSFDLTKSEEIKKAFSPSNHRWLLKEDNLKKGKKIILLSKN